MTTPETLQQIGIRCGAGKCSHSYMPTYERLLSHLRDKPINLLEVGIDEGKSLKMWLEWFRNSGTRIYGVDNDVNKMWMNWPMGDGRNFDQRVKTHFCSQVDPKITHLFPSESLDVIIDDASHATTEQQYGCQLLWPCLKPGGFYIVEDVQEISMAYAWAKQYRHFRMFTWNFHRHYDRDWQPDDVLFVVRKPPLPEGDGFEEVIR